MYELAGSVHPVWFLFSGLFWYFGSLHQRRCDHLLRHRHQGDDVDVAASLKPAAAAAAILSGLDVAASLMPGVAAAASAQ